MIIQQSLVEAAQPTGQERQADSVVPILQSQL